MYHEYPRLFKGNFPHAVRHAAVTEGFPAGVDMALKLAKDPDFCVDDAEMYVAACLATKGQPHLADLLDREDDR